MSEGLRGLVERKLILVGPRLQTLWADLSLLSFPTGSSPQRSHFSIISEHDDPSEGTLLPTFHAPLAKNNVLAPEGSASDKVALEPMTTPSSLVADVQPFRGTSVSVSTQTEPFESQKGRALDMPQSEQSAEKVEDEKVRTEGADARTSHDILSSPQAAPKILDGPSQVVVARYNDEDHLAILITKELLDRLGRAMELERELEGLKSKLEDSEREVAFAEYSVKDQRELLQEAETEEEGEEHRQAIDEQQSLYKTEKARYESLKSELLVLKGNADYVEGMARDVFQEPLMKEGLLEEYSDPTDKEKTGKIESRNLGSDDNQPGSYDDGDDLTASEVSTGEVERMRIQEEIDRRYAEFVQAGRDFDNRHERESQQRAKYREMVFDGTCLLAQTEFDHRLMEAARLTTQDLEDAENAYEEVLARRKTLGPNSYHQESGFITDEEDGYPLSSEEDEDIKEGLGQWISTWLVAVPEVANIPDLSNRNDGAVDEFGCESQVDLSEWDSRSAHMSDSWSCRDGTRNRKRIDRWQEMTGRRCR